MKSCMESHLPHEIEIANSFTRVAIEFAIAFAGHVSNFQGGHFAFIIDETQGLTNLVSSSRVRSVGVVRRLTARCQ